MRQLLLVGLGGFLGALARYGLMGAIYALFPFPPRFPLATLLVNLLGSFLLGIITGIGEFRGAIDASVRAFLVIGFLGSMTTYSTFIGESFALLRLGEWVMLGLNLATHFTLGFIAFWLGLLMSQTLWG